MKCDEEMREKVEMLELPPENKQKVLMSDDDDVLPSCPKEYAYVPDELDEKMQEMMQNHKGPFTLDVSQAKRIFLDLQTLHDAGFPDQVIDAFMEDCLNLFNLLVYDCPGGPQVGGYGHRAGEFVLERDRKYASYAVDCYNKTCKVGEDSRLTLVNVERVTIASIPAFVYYMTLTALDELTNEAITCQAEIMEPGDGDQPIFGMLRDADHGKVLAIAELRGGSEKDATATDSDATTMGANTPTTQSKSSESNTSTAGSDISSKPDPNFRLETEADPTRKK